MDLKEHQRNVDTLFQYWDETAVKLNTELKHACMFRFNERIEKYGFLDLHELDEMRNDLMSLDARIFRNFLEGNFLDSINLTIIKQWVLRNEGA